MDDQDRNAVMDHETNPTGQRLEQAAQIDSDLKAFSAALMQALRYVPPPQIDEAA